MNKESESNRRVHSSAAEPTKVAAASGLRAVGFRSTSALLISGARNQLAYLGAFVVKNVFLVVFLYIFQALWKTVYGERELIAGITLVQMVWYLTYTECITIGRSPLWRTVQDEVRDGTVAYGLTRPVPYPRLTMARFVGEGLIRLLPLLVLGAAVALLAVGPLPRFFRGFISALPLMAGALVLIAQAEMLVGLAAFRLEEVSPVYWIFQKTMFFLGGLFYPLDLYPPVFAEVLKWGPLASFAYWPAHVAVNGGEGLERGLLNLAVWMTVGATAVNLAYRRAMKNVQAQGG